METFGVVKRIEGQNAVVKVARTSACGGNCASCSACGNREIETVVKNRIGAKAGDVVKINTASANVLFSAFVLYVLPVLLFLLAYFSFAAFFQTATAVILSLAIVVFLYFLIKKFERKLAADSEITEIVKEYDK